MNVINTAYNYVANKFSGITPRKNLEINGIPMKPAGALNSVPVPQDGTDEYVNVARMLVFESGKGLVLGVSVEPGDPTRGNVYAVTPKTFHIAGKGGEKQFSCSAFSGVAADEKGRVLVGAGGDDHPILLELVLLVLDRHFEGSGFAFDH